MSANEDPFRDPPQTGEVSSSKSAEELNPATLLNQAYEKWYIGYESQLPRLTILYKYCPAWDALWAAVWHLFDLVEDCRHAGSQVPPWHQSVVRLREKFDLERQQNYMAVTEKHWILCPLSVHLDRYCKSKTLDRLYTWKATISNWNRFREMYQGETKGELSLSTQPFRRSLSSFQLSSYQILDDWWHSRYAPEELVASVRSFLERHESVTNLEVKSDAANSETMTNASIYHSYCFRLFLHEFHPQLWEPYMAGLNLKKLQQHRFNSACHAIAQRISISSLMPSWEACKTEYPRPELNVSPLPEDDSDKGYPHYLWDREAQTTVVVSELDQCPPYTCVSHTWGRWRLKSAANVKGVPWSVPENSLYNVRDLPRILTSLSHAYIWLDLLCIPQDGSVLADYEISRQCAIFRGSTCCIAWFHDVSSWKGVENALDWLGLKYLACTARLGSRYSITEQMLRQAADSADTKVELISPEPVTWFSSLWTLQEAIICPDLHLHSKDWTCLTDRSGSAITLTALLTFLDLSMNFIAFSKGIIDASISDPNDYLEMLSRTSRGGRMSLPLGPRYIIYLPTLTGLHDVLVNFSPSRIFVNATMRRCSDSRAPAIMSALRITKWYSDRIQHPKRWSCRRREKLVLDTYPLPFIQEAFKVFGARLLDGASAEGRRLSLMDYITRKARGSMLPFSARTGWAADRMNNGKNDGITINIVDHEAVRHWSINAYGGLKITRAGIFASSRGKKATIAKFGIFWTMKEDSNMRRRVDTDFHAQLQEIAGHGIVYAIALYEDNGWQHGILLHSPPISVFGRRYLLRVGYYIVTQRTEMPPSSSVDWVVL